MPSIPKYITVLGPRPANPGAPVTAAIHSGDLTTILRKIRENASLIFGNFNSNQQVLIKINLNSPFPYPASTDPNMVAGIVDILRERGIERIKVGDCTSLGFLPTRNVVRMTGLADALRGRAAIIAFDQGGWVRVETGGGYLPGVTVPAAIFEADRVINLANIKTHPLADFSLGMKSLVGFQHPAERRDLHWEWLQEKIGDLATAIKPDLTIIDARRLFVSGGPNEGREESGDRVFIGTDWLATDLAAYAYLYTKRLDSGGAEHFTADPFSMRQFRIFSGDEGDRAASAPWKVL